MTTPFQRDLLHYLTEPGHDERAKALDDLRERLVFASFIEAADERSIIEQYLKDNPRGFCQAGILRFRKAFGFETNRRIVDELRFEVCVEDYPEGIGDGRLGVAFLDALVGRPLQGGGKIVGVRQFRADGLVRRERGVFK